MSLKNKLFSINIVIAITLFFNSINTFANPLIIDPESHLKIDGKGGFRYHEKRELSIEGEAILQYTSRIKINPLKFYSYDNAISELAKTKASLGTCNNVLAQLSKLLVEDNDAELMEYGHEEEKRIHACSYKYFEYGKLRSQIFFLKKKKSEIYILYLSSD